MRRRSNRLGYFKLLLSLFALCSLTHCGDRATNTPANLPPSIEIIDATDHIVTEFSSVISFRVVDPESEVITWTAKLENGAGSKISPRAAGPIPSGSKQQVLFQAGRVITEAKITLVGTDSSGKSSVPVALIIEVEIM